MLIRRDEQGALTSADPKRLASEVAEVATNAEQYGKPIDVKAAIVPQAPTVPAVPI